MRKSRRESRSSLPKRQMQRPAPKSLRSARTNAVETAAREQRVARAVLRKGLTPSHPGWRESEQRAYEARLRRWRTASRALVAALNELADQRRHDDDAAAAT